MATGWIKSLGRLCVGLLIVLIVLVLAVLGVFVSRGGALLVMMILFPVLVVTIERYRRWRFNMVVGYLEQAVRLNLPLPRMLDAAARSETGSTRRQLHSVSDALLCGDSVATALRRGAPGAPPEALAVIDAAETVGTLPAALRRVLGQARAELSARRADDALFVAYPGAVTLVMVILLSGLMIFIVPKFDKIFDDFGIELPAATQLLTEVSRRHAPLVLSAVFSWLLLWLAWGVVRARVPGVRLFPGVRDQLAWGVTPLRGLLLSKQLAALCQAIADGLTHHLPLPDALDDASRAVVNRVLARRVQAWAQSVRDGRAIADGARSAGMPAFLVSMVGTGEASANLPDTMTFLARYYSSRFSRVLLLLRNSVLPVVVLVLSVVVGFVVISMFMPLVSLIQSVTEFSF